MNSKSLEVVISELKDINRAAAVNPSLECAEHICLASRAAMVELMSIVQFKGRLLDSKESNSLQVELEKGVELLETLTWAKDAAHIIPQFTIHCRKRLETIRTTVLHGSEVAIENLAEELRDRGNDQRLNDE